MTLRELTILEEEPLPPLYQGWVREVLPGPIPREHRATCSSCAMIPLVDPPAPDTPSHAFHSLSKCCTYLPEIPNYLVGAILADADPDGTFGKESVLGRIAQEGGVSVTGLQRTPLYEIAYKSASDAGAFGKMPALRCPHYIEGNGGCGVWKFRNSVCSTWFCKFSRGAVGSEFWKLLKSYLAAIEYDLSIHCALEAGASYDMVFTDLELRRVPVSKRVAEELVVDTHNMVMKDKWGSWQGRQSESFLKCFEISNGLSWAEVRALCGPEVRVLEGAMLAAHAKLQDRHLPMVLKLATVSGHRIGKDWYQLATFSSHDPIAVTTEVWDHLPSFDGRPTTEVLETLPAEAAQSFTASEIQRLVDYRIFVAAP
jgi:Fe-S-cluster containining protein